METLTTLKVIHITATVLLLTDPDHAVPVVVARNGVRLIVYGRGRSDLGLRAALRPLAGSFGLGHQLLFTQLFLSPQMGSPIRRR